MTDSNEKLKMATCPRLRISCQPYNALGRHAGVQADDYLHVMASISAMNLDNGTQDNFTVDHAAS